MNALYAGIMTAAAVIITSPQAKAALVETVTITNTFGYNFSSGQSADQQIGGERQTIFVEQRPPTPESDLGVDYVGQADVGSFFFLHNNYCVGACSTGSRTVITFSVTNTGDTPVDLRFDSLITPGHLARVDGSGPARGGFSFSVTQRTDGLSDRSLYTAFGSAGEERLSVGNALGTGFDGQVEYDLPGGRVLDWSSTPLNLELGTLAAGATTQVEYAASYFLTVLEACQEVIACGGLQVVFGDPRNNGSVSTLTRAFSALATGDPVPMINREYDAVRVPYAFNISGTAFPDLPPAQGPVSYEGTYAPLNGGIVPEPATWTSLVVGMALLGSALRRSRRRDVLARSRLT